MAGTPRVLVLHNRYRLEAGEERAVALHLAALGHAGVEHRLVERRSGVTGRGRAAAALLRGGEREREVADAAAAMSAQIVHAHNIQPLFGPRSLAAARRTGARVVMHLHNLRLFCAIGVASRDGGPCFSCHHRRTLPGLLHNCRGSLPEAAVYAAGLSLHEPRTLAAADLFIAPSESGREQAARLGVPAERLAVLPHYIPDAEIAAGSVAEGGGFALVAARLAPEKGVDVAIRAAALAGVPLRVAGEGPSAAELAALARDLGAPVEFLGRVERPALAALVREAAVVLMPSRFHEFAGYAAMEAMAAGVPVLASSLGALPEIVGPQRCVPSGDADALAAPLRALWEQPELRHVEGEALLARLRERHSEAGFTAALLGLYERVLS